MRVVPTFLICLILSAPSSLHSQQVSLSPLASYDSFRSSGFSSGIDFGAGAAVRLAPGLRVSAAFTLGPREQSFDVIGGTESLRGRIFVLSGALDLRVLGRESGAALSLSVGGGRMSLSVDPLTVSLGALGTLQIPGRSIAQGFFQAGLTGEIPLTERIAIVMLPSARFMTGSGQGSDYALAGGLRVGLF